MSGRRVEAHDDAAVALNQINRDGVRGKPDVAALASFDENRLCVMVWHDRIDEEHSNAPTRWNKLGSPHSPSDQPYAELEATETFVHLKRKLKTVTDPMEVNALLGKRSLFLAACAVFWLSIVGHALAQPFGGRGLGGSRRTDPTRFDRFSVKQSYPIEINIVTCALTH